MELVGAQRVKRLDVAEWPGIGIGHQAWLEGEAWQVTMIVHREDGSAEAVLTPLVERMALPG